jgi:hypothetical protein
LRAGACSIYSEREGAARHGQVDHGDDATAAQRSGRGARTVQRGLAILVDVIAQQEVDGVARATSTSVTGPAEVVDDGVGYRARVGRRACLGGS